MSDKNFILSKIRFKNKKRSKSDRALKVFIFIFTFAYIIFFTSNFFFPKVYRNIAVAQIGKVFNLDDYMLTLYSWDYSDKDDAFEIILGIENLTLEKEIDYSFIAMQKDKIYDCNIYRKIGDDMLVLRVYGVSDSFSEVRLEAGLGKKKAYLNTSYKAVNKVEKLLDKTDKQYMIYASESKIKGIAKNIEDLQADLDKLKDKMNYAYEKINSLEEKKKSQSEEEAKLTSESISKISTELEKLKSEADENLIYIQNYREKIQKEKQKLKELQK